MPAIGSDDQIGMNGELAARGFDAHTLHHAVLLEQVHTFSLHAQLKLRVNSPAFREEVEEVPLRHERDELCVRGQVGEVANPKLRVPDLHGYTRELLMRLLEKLFKDAQFIHQLESGGMHCIAAKIAKKVGVLLE